MFPLLIAGPAVEVVPLAEMKAWLRVDTADEDDIIGMIGTAARLTVEAATGRFLIAQDWRLTLDAWPRAGCVRVPGGPIIAVLGARVRDAAGLATELDPAGFVPDRRSDPPAIGWSANLPAPGRASQGIELDMRLGYGPAAADVPEPLRQAIRLLTAHWFERRGEGAQAAGAPLPPDVVALISPFRRARL